MWQKEARDQTSCTRSGSTRPKTGADGELDRHKPRLVACGSEQGLGVDYNLIFAAVMDISSFKVVLALAESWGVLAKHGDIPITYVKADKEAHLDICLSVPRDGTCQVTHCASSALRTHARSSSSFARACTA